MADASARASLPTDSYSLLPPRWLTMLEPMAMELVTTARVNMTDATTLSLVFDIPSTSLQQAPVSSGHIGSQQQVRWIKIIIVP